MITFKNEVNPTQLHPASVWFLLGHLLIAQNTNFQQAGPAAAAAAPLSLAVAAPLCLAVALGRARLLAGSLGRGDRHHALGGAQVLHLAAGNLPLHARGARLDLRGGQGDRGRD